MTESTSLKISSGDYSIKNITNKDHLWYYILTEKEVKTENKIKKLACHNMKLTS